MSKALLLVVADPSPTMEEEFNAWYDTEHVPERASIPGFNTALRFVSLGDGPAYMALYDLDDLAVLDSPAYQAVYGVNFTPWTRRVTSRVNPARLTGVQMFPVRRSRVCAPAWFWCGCAMSAMPIWQPPLRLWTGFHPDTAIAPSIGCLSATSRQGRMALCCSNSMTVTQIV